MLTLGIDSSAVAASAALVEDGKLLGEFYCNTKQVHSQTLLPMVEGLLQTVGRSCGELDAIAVSHGPGSFTGVRIGVSCVKGIALPKNIPCVGVSTLEAIAYSGIPYEDAILCAVMDARRNQVYNARFRSTGDGLLRLRPDRAVALAELAEELKTSGKPQILVGDGAVLCYTTLKESGLDVRLAPPHLRFQSAWGVARCALEQVRTGRLTDAASLSPDYHRLSQAERERLAKEQNKGE